MSFLCIQNPGVAPIEGFTLLGVCTTRDCGVEGTIGQFGSGNKHAINVLYVRALKVFVYCGKTRLDFQTRDEEIDDGLTRKAIKRVVCKLSGTSTRTIDLGWVLDFGSIDWSDIGMALREFVSNSIDRTVREENGSFIPALDDERLLRAASCPTTRCGPGTASLASTSKSNESVQQLHGRVAQSLPALFLGPGPGHEVLLAQGQPQLNGKKTAVIYRAGVFVREIEE